MCNSVNDIIIDLCQLNLEYENEGLPLCSSDGNTVSHDVITYHIKQGKYRYIIFIFAETMKNSLKISENCKKINKSHSAGLNLLQIKGPERL